MKQEDKDKIVQGHIAQSLEHLDVAYSFVVEAGEGHHYERAVTDLDQYVAALSLASQSADRAVYAQRLEVDG